MKKFLQFVSAADDAATFPADSLQSMVCDADAVVKMRFHPSTKGTAHLVDLVTLTITSDQEAAVMEAISKEIAFGKDTFVGYLQRRDWHQLSPAHLVLCNIH